LPENHLLPCWTAGVAEEIIPLSFPNHNNTPTRESDMGLAVSVFPICDVIVNDGSRKAIEQVRKQFRAINALLEEHKLPPHNEPETRPEEARARSHVGSFPYDYMRHLRRFYANACRHRGDRKKYPLIPRRTDDEISEAESWIADTLEYDFSSQLLCHSIYEGYFVPMPQDDHLCGDVPGGFLGSTNGLVKELLFLAPLLKIKLTKKGELSDREHAKLWAACNDPDEPWMFEKVTWLTLWENARLSLQYGTAMVYH
jgi:hypothetical protein